MSCFQDGPQDPDSSLSAQSIHLWSKNQLNGPAKMFSVFSDIGDGTRFGVPAKQDQ